MTRSVTTHIEGLRNGNPEAANQLWARYFKRVAGLAKKHLQKGDVRAADEEDIVAIVFHRLWEKLQAGEGSWVTDRNSLWVLLARITAGETIDLLKHEGRKKRGGGQVRGESAFAKLDQGEPGYDGMDQMIGKEVTPEFVVLMRDQCRHLLERLKEDERKIALLKLEGCTAEEIHNQYPRLTVNMIEKRLALIRRKWMREWEAITGSPKSENSANPKSDNRY